jgi:hypothetical protein
VPLRSMSYMAISFAYPIGAPTLTFPYRDRLAEQEDHCPNNEVVIPSEIAPQVSRVHSASNKDGRKDREDGDDGENLLLPAFHHGN